MGNIVQPTSHPPLSPSLNSHLQSVNRRRGPEGPGVCQQDPGRVVGQPGRPVWLRGRRRLHHQWLQLHQWTGTAHHTFVFFNTRSWRSISWCIQGTVVQYHRRRCARRGGLCNLFYESSNCDSFSVQQGNFHPRKVSNPERAPPSWMHPRHEFSFY